MRPAFQICLIFLSGILMAGSCKQPVETVSGGGKGGSSTITVSGEHRGSLIDTCMIYIKYNSLDAPANAVYDDSATSVLINGKPTATFSGLTTGNYYLLAVGYHGGFSPPNVKGGKKCSVFHNGDTASVVIPTYQYSL